MTQRVYIHTPTGPITEISEHEMGLIITALRAQSNSFRIHFARYQSEEPALAAGVARAFNDVINGMDSLSSKLHELVD